VKYEYNQRFHTDCTKKMNIAVIAIGYNRKYSLERLLNSLEGAEYPEDVKVTLIISLDKSDIHQEMEEYFERFNWSHGDRIVRKFETRQGLKKHILSCGDLVSEYDAVALFEDDLIVSRYYYYYLQAVIERYENDEQIAGISMYSPRVNPYCRRPFEAVNDGHDVYMMQVAQSWGQCWTKKMWSNFKKWFYENGEMLKEENDMPVSIYGWGSKSWLKYYMKYLAVTGKYYVFPYTSLTSNCGEIGEHYSSAEDYLQVPLLEGKISCYRLPSIGEAIKYDPFYERIGLDLVIDEKRKVIMDLYGLKTVSTEDAILVTTDAYQYKVLRTFGLKYYPHEVNCAKQTPGRGIYVYDLSVKEDKKIKRSLATDVYDAKGLRWKSMLKYGINGLFGAIRSKIGKR